MDEPPVPTPTRRRWALVAVAAAVAAGIAVTLTVWLWPTHAARRPVVIAAPQVVETVETPTPLPTSTTPAPPPPRHVVPHDVVAPAVPTAFTLAGKGFRISAHVCAMAPVFPLDPPGEQHHTVCWVAKGFGVMPSSHGATSYVLGHAWAEDPQEVLNKASARATRQVLREKPRQLDGVPVYPATSLIGSNITLRTPHGVLRYEVRNAFGVDKYKLGNIDSIMNPHVRNRVVVITCAELNGVDYNYNIVLDARLVASRNTADKA